MTAGHDITDHRYEIDIAYSPAALIDKLERYCIKPEKAYSEIKIDAKQLHVLFSTVGLNQQQSLAPLRQAIEHWKNGDADQFFAQINHLVYAWLNAGQVGVSQQTILSILKCFRFNSYFNKADTARLHLFLFDLAAETAYTFQQQTLHYLLRHDTETHLPVTEQLAGDLSANLLHSAPEDIIAVFCIGFQTTKRQNTLSTFNASDLNKHIANVLRQQITPGFHLYYGGDRQFDVLMPQLRNSSQLDLFAAKIMRAFEDMIFLNDQSILIKPLIGCSYNLVQGVLTESHKENDSAELYINARLALDNAIETQQTLCIYNEQLKNRLIEQNCLESQILEAFNNDHLTLFFQPIVDLKKMKCVGAELLLRWPGTDVSPSFIIEILNKLGKGKLFTRWLVNSACRYVSELHKNHFLMLYLTLNLRAEDLYDIELPHRLFQAVALWKISAEHIILELTENGILEYNDSTNFVIKQLSEAGFKFAVDDFGTGYSSLSRLRNMPIDLIKIDQSFVRNITGSREDYEIVQSIALLAKSLGKEVLVEGIEEAQCLELIKTMNIDKCQGYFFAPPMPFEDFIDWATNDDTRKNHAGNLL